MAVMQHCLYDYEEGGGEGYHAFYLFGCYAFCLVDEEVQDTDVCLSLFPQDKCGIVKGKGAGACGFACAQTSLGMIGNGACRAMLRGQGAMSG